MNITTATFAQIDAEIARIDALVDAQYSRMDRAVKVLDGKYTSDHAKAQAQKTIDQVGAELDALRIEAAPLHAEFRNQGGWTRYYLVEGGHLHYDVSAHRCSRIPATSHYWITEQSGATAEAVIELAGERVCTTCFPNAPVAVLSQPSKLLTKTEAEKVEARTARGTAAAAKEAKRVAGLIYAADGNTLHNGFGEIKTEREALSAYLDSLVTIALREDDAETELNRAKDQSFEDLKADHERVLNEFHRPFVEPLLAALAAKRDVEVETLRAELAKKVPAKVRAAKKEGAQFRARNSHFFANA